MPGSLAATAINSTSAILSWSDVNTETSYEIRYGSTIIPVGANITSYLLTGLTQNTLYSFTVRAKNNISDFTDSLALAYTTAPAEPTVLAIGTLTPTQVQLTWMSNSSGALNYNIERKVGIFGSFSLLASPSSCGNACQMTYPDNGPFTAGELYFYRVQAKAGSLLSGFSNIVSTVLPTNNLIIVKNIVDHGNPNDTDSLSWAITQANNGSNKTIIFQITGGLNTVTFDGASGAIPAATAGVKIVGTCDPTTGPVIKIKNSAAGVFDGITLQQGAIAFGLQISGFTGNQIIAGTPLTGGGDNATGCIKTSKALL
jgi:hypothetical protein